MWKKGESFFFFFCYQMWKKYSLVFNLLHLVHYTQGLPGEEIKDMFLIFECFYSMWKLITVHLEYEEYIPESSNLVHIGHSWADNVTIDREPEKCTRKQKMWHICKTLWRFNKIIIGQTNTRIVSNVILEKLLRAHIHGLFWVHRRHLKLNWTKLNWTAFVQNK